jgi:hypothetical protein
LDLPGQNSDGEFFGTVLKQKVVTVAHLIFVGPVVKSRDGCRFNSATGRDLIPGNLLHHSVGQGVPQGDGESGLQNTGHTDVVDLVFSASDFSNELSFFSGPLDFGYEFQVGLGEIR